LVKAAPSVAETAVPVALKGASATLKVLVLAPVVEPPASVTLTLKVALCRYSG